MLVIFEEAGAKPDEIEILTVDRDTICSFITDYHPPNINSWQLKKHQFQAALSNAKSAAELKCPNRKKISVVEFASLGNPMGPCGEYEHGNCTIPVTKIVEERCLGKESCSIPMDKSILMKNNGDACPGIMKNLAIQVKCSA